MQIFKQVFGLDIASQSLVAAVGTIDTHQNQSISPALSFENSSDGAQQLIAWIQQHRLPEVPCWVVMEATGVYHERLALILHEHGYSVSIVLANKIYHFAKSENQKSKTDRIDAGVITRYGLERQLTAWQPPELVLQKLKALVREHDDINHMLTEIRNRLHASERSAAAPKTVIKRLRQQRELLKQQIKQIQQELKELVEQSEDLSDAVECISSIPGIGLLTAVTVLAETNNFQLMDNPKQLISYCGLDPRLRQSGKYHGRTMISGQGNRHLRRSLYMPALTAIRRNPLLKRFYQRIISTKSSKMIGVVAVMRKLLRLMFILWKKRQMFNPLYQQNALVPAP
jgi:transposase